VWLIATSIFSVKEIWLSFILLKKRNDHGQRNELGQIAAGSLDTAKYSDAALILCLRSSAAKHTREEQPWPSSVTEYWKFRFTKLCDAICFGFKSLSPNFRYEWFVWQIKSLICVISNMRIKSIQNTPYSTYN